MKDQNIDYFGMIKESLDFAWKYKILWVFGFVLALFSGGNRGNLSIPSDESGSNEVGDFVAWADKVIKSPYFWYGVAGLILLVIVMMIVRWYLSTVANVALIKAVDMDRKDEEFRFWQLWKMGHKYLWKFLALGIIGFLVMLVIMIPFIAVFIVLSVVLGGDEPAFAAIWPLACCLIPMVAIVILVVSIIFNAIYLGASRGIVFEDLGVVQSIAKGWELFRKFWTKYILAWLAMLVPGCLFGIVVAFFMFLGMAPLFIFVIAMIANPSTAILGLIGGGCGMCGLTILVAVIQAPFQVFSHAYWTKFYMRVKEMGTDGRGYKQI